MLHYVSKVLLSDAKVLLYNPKVELYVSQVQRCVFPALISQCFNSKDSIYQLCDTISKTAPQFRLCLAGHPELRRQGAEPEFSSDCHDGSNPCGICFRHYTHGMDGRYPLFRCGDCRRAVQHRYRKAGGPGISRTAPRCGAGKDIAAGAVLVCAVAAAIIGLIIFIPYL